MHSSISQSSEVETQLPTCRKVSGFDELTLSNCIGSPNSSHSVETTLELGSLALTACQVQVFS